MTGWNKDFNDLCGLYPNIELSLLICDKAKCTKNSTIMQTAWCYDDNTSYLIRLQCTSCKSEWMVCKKCPLKKKLIQKLQVTSHKWKYHDRKKTTETNTMCYPIVSNDIISKNTNSINEREINNTNIRSDTDSEDTSLGKLLIIVTIPITFQKVL